jgi:hypothetical protein
MIQACTILPQRSSLLHPNPVVHVKLFKALARGHFQRHSDKGQNSNKADIDKPKLAQVDTLGQSYKTFSS